MKWEGTDPDLWHLSSNIHGLHGLENQVTISPRLAPASLSLSPISYKADPEQTHRTHEAGWGEKSEPLAGDAGDAGGREKSHMGETKAQV